MQTPKLVVLQNQFCQITACALRNENYKTSQVQRISGFKLELLSALLPDANRRAIVPVGQVFGQKPPVQPGANCSNLSFPFMFL